jgi:selenocysteine lyase/cysteine desulfurase
MMDRREAIRAFAALSGAWLSAKGLKAEETFALPARPAQYADESYWQRLRWQFLIPHDQAFFNTGTLGASPKVVVDTVVRHLLYVEESLTEWDYSEDKPERLAGYRPETVLREKIAAFIGCDFDEVGLTLNATMGMNFLANGIDLDPGDEVLMTDREHGGGRAGWDLKAKRYGTVVKEAQIPDVLADPDAIIRVFESAITPKTKVITFPHITSGQGIVLPAKRLVALARDRGIFSVVDGAQAVGQIQVDVRDIGSDAYFFSPHKWLLAPKGTGVLYIRREAQERIWPTLASYQWDKADDGMYRLTQYGTHNLSLLRGLEAAIDFMRQMGPEHVETRIRTLGSYLRQGLSEIPRVRLHTPTHPDLAAGITRYGIEGIEGTTLQDELWHRKRIRVRGAPAVRQSCHIYNDFTQLDETLEVVRELTKT